MSIGDYKRTVESYVVKTCKLGGLLAFGSTLMDPILAAAQPVATLQVYVGINEALQRPYEDLIVTIIMIKGCSYGSLKKWLAQNQLIAGAQAYITVRNELVDMINTGTSPPDASKQKQKKGKMKGDKETVGAIIEVGEEPSPTNILPVEYEHMDSVDSNSNNSDLLHASVFPAGEESHTSSKHQIPNQPWSMY